MRDNAGGGPIIANRGPTCTDVLDSLSLEMRCDIRVFSYIGLGPSGNSAQFDFPSSIKTQPGPAFLFLFYPSHTPLVLASTSATLLLLLKS